MTIEPIERNTVRYFLYFDREDLTVQIDKPEGIEKSEFSLKQNNDGFGRYMTFADDTQITFIPRKDHKFTKLCDLYKVNKWQNSAYLIIKIDGVEFMRGRLKFEEVETDYTYFFSIKIDVNTQREIIESKKSTTINLNSTKSVDDKDITKIELTDVLTKFKEIYIDSRVEFNHDTYPYYLDCSGDYGSTNASIYINMFNKNINSGNEVTVVEDEKIFNLGHNPDLLTRFVADNDNTRVS